MRTIENLPTSDDYSSALTLEDDEAEMLSYVVANNSAVAKFRGARRPMLPGGAYGGVGSYGSELLITPEKNVVPNCSGVRFRSAEAGKPAQVIAFLLGAEDPQVGAGIPFFAALSARGGVGTVGVIDRQYAFDYAADNGEQSLYSFLVAAGQLSANGILDLFAEGDYLHNNVGADTLTLRVKFGGVTFYQQAINFGGSVGAVRHPWSLRLRIANLGFSNSQHIAGQFTWEAADGVAPTVGIGNVAANSAGIGAGGSQAGNLPGFAAAGLGSVDTTVAQTLDVTGQWSAASANNSMRRRFAVLESI